MIENRTNLCRSSRHVQNFGNELHEDEAIDALIKFCTVHIALAQSSRPGRAGQELDHPPLPADMGTFLGILNYRFGRFPECHS